jgi:methionyl-tRNA synthetase
MAKFTVATSIHYPNAKPHLGHALEFVQADFLARYHRMKGDDVYFQTGLDMYGLKNQRAAEKAGLAVEQYVDEQSQYFVKLAQDLSIQYDHFIRTTDQGHQAMAQALWRACAARGDIYKKTYRAWYNVKQEEFLGSADEIPNPDVFDVDPQFIELIEEENYFFAASKYTDQVLGLLKDGALKIYPKHRAAELIRFVEEKGMQDVSISRDRERLSWGVPVPDDDKQVMYVWFDALTNYLTGCASLEDGTIVTDSRWPVDLHCIGKDISRFHGLLWPAMLLSAGLETPKAILVHGFILKDGHVMSKTRGNVIDPEEVIGKFGADPVRWFFLRGLPATEDGEFTMERVAEVYSSNLANDYGNLVSRVLAMTHKYCDGNVPNVVPESVANLEKVVTHENWGDYDNALDALDINGGLNEAQELIVFCNRRIDELKPWEMAKDEGRRHELEAFLYELLEVIRHITAMIWPAIPTSAERVAKELFVSIPVESWQNPDFSRTWGKLEPGSKLGPTPLILFPRHD